MLNRFFILEVIILYIMELCLFLLFVIILFKDILNFFFLLLLFFEMLKLYFFWVNIGLWLLIFFIVIVNKV